MTTIDLDDGEQQLVLMALAHLANKRPGFDHALNEIALKMDERREGRAQLFEEFKGLDPDSDAEKAKALIAALAGGGAATLKATRHCDKCRSGPGSVKRCICECHSPIFVPAAVRP